VGKQIGPYKLLQNIGEGGCGNVFMAEQEAPVRRRVALKVIKLGMDTKNVIARFEAERQALAMMDHPNIARVLDAGATRTGRPYFVMELVHGVRITDYCDENCLGTRQRLELFIQVCNAIQHAHQKGIIHRDIKPSNILVTVDTAPPSYKLPLPKVIDFGIAKATSGQVLTDKTLFTACEQFVGTPAYMSPEQAEMSPAGAGDVDTRSDIYSLGVLLYELLTGKTPFDQKELLQSGLDAMRRTLREREPHRPSTKLDALRAEELTRTALKRRVEPRKLKSLLTGDLDWIVMKALEKDRARRYQTANALAADIQHYLANEPVVARPPSRVYRFQKLVRRNRIVFAAGAAVTVTLLGGTGFSTWMFFRESAARKDSERARANEAQLRLQAETREKVTQAAVFISRHQLAEADALLNAFPDELCPPSMEAAAVFSSLGDWHATHGRWKQAADRYVTVIDVNQVDASDKTDTATRDLLRAGPALVATGNFATYWDLVRTANSRILGSTNPVAAEHVIKTSLILPADRDVLESLEPLAEVVRKSVHGDPPTDPRAIYMAAWRVFALGLLEYRLGNYEQSLAWNRAGLSFGDSTPTRVAMTQIVLAMANHRLGNVTTAQDALVLPEKVIHARMPNGLDDGLELGKDATGYWHDWIMAYTLLCEARSTIDRPSNRN
jgi:serine/threonine protein kinase